MPIHDPVTAPPPATKARPASDAPWPSDVERFEACLECEAFVEGREPPSGQRDPDRREVERGVARMGTSRGRHATLRATGLRLGHRSTPCACCRRPVPGVRVVLERALSQEFEEG